MTQRIILAKEYETWGTLVATGKVPDTSHVFKYGYNAAISTSTETVWTYGGEYNWLGAATVLKITSNHTDDDVAGDGALTLMVEGLDADYAEISETVILTGQVSKNTTKSYLRVHRMYVLTAGVSLTNVGEIFAFTGAHTTGDPDVSTTVHSHIAAGAGQTLQAFYTVPAAKTALMYTLNGTCSDNTNSIVLSLRTRLEGAAWRVKEQFAVHQGSVLINKQFPKIITEKTDIEVQGLATGAVVVSASMDLVLST